MSSDAGSRPRRITPVILSGGSGTRLWPVSRAARPKQMLALDGARTMIQLTAARVADDRRFEAPIVVAGEALADSAAAQLEQAGVAPGLTIVEPAARNTAPAIALAALAAGDDALLLVMPSDHLIGDVPAFMTAVDAATPFADHGWLVTFGIRPTRAETAFGYIRRGGEIAPGVFRADRFVEKPDAATAAAYLAQGGHDWNAGIFLFRAGAYLAALAKHAADIDTAARDAIEGAERDGARLYPSAAVFEAAPARSIDHAVMEHADNVAVVPADIGWSDVGSWQALYETSSRDARGNAATGDVLLVDADACLVRSEGPLVVAIGVEGLAIVATGDAVLVVPREDSQRVQEAVAALRARRDRRL